MKNIRIIFMALSAICMTQQICADYHPTIYPPVSGGPSFISDPYIRTAPEGCIRDRNNPFLYRCVDGSIVDTTAAPNDSEKSTKTSLTDQQICKQFINEIPSLLANKKYVDFIAHQNDTKLYGIATNIPGTRSYHLKHLSVDPEKMADILTTAIKTLPKKYTFQDLYKTNLAAVKKVDTNIDPYFKAYNNHEEAYYTLIELFGSKHGLSINQQDGTIWFQPKKQSQTTNKP